MHYRIFNSSWRSFSSVEFDLSSNRSGNDSLYSGAGELLSSARIVAISGALVGMKEPVS